MLLRGWMISLLWVGMLLVPARGQVLNVESKRFQKDTIGWMGISSFRASLIKNVTQVFQYGNNTQVQYRTQRARILMLNELNYFRSNGVAALNTGYSHVRLGMKVRPKTTWESFAQGQYNRPLRLDYRWSIGTGMRFRIVKNEKFRMYAASLPIVEWEREQGSKIWTTTPRLSSYCTLTWVFAPDAECEYTMYYQPSLLLARDYRLAGEASVRFRIRKWLSFYFAYQYLLDQAQPFGVPNWTYRFDQRFEIHF